MDLKPKVWDAVIIFGVLILLVLSFISSETPEKSLEPLGISRWETPVTPEEARLPKTSPIQRARLFISVESTKTEPVAPSPPEAPADLTPPPAPDRSSLVYLGGVTDQEKVLFYFKDKRSGRLLPLNLDKPVDGWILSISSPTLWSITDPEGKYYEVNR